MSNLGYFFLSLGVIFSLFFFWRRLKDDYLASQIFNVSFLTLFLTSVFIFSFKFLISKKLSLLYFLNPQTFWFWPLILGIFLGVSLASKYYGFKFYEITESAISSLFILLIFIFFSFFIFTNNTLFFIPVGFVAIFLILYLWMTKNYKKFTWYRSGRLGFAGLTSFAIFLISRSIVALTIPSVLSLVGVSCSSCTFTGPADTLIAAVVSFIVFLNLFNLSLK